MHSTLFPQFNQSQSQPRPTSAGIPSESYSDSTQQSKLGEEFDSFLRNRGYAYGAPKDSFDEMLAAHPELRELGRKLAERHMQHGREVIASLTDENIAAGAMHPENRRALQRERDATISLSDEADELDPNWFAQEASYIEPTAAERAKGDEVKIIGDVGQLISFERSLVARK